MRVDISNGRVSPALEAFNHALIGVEITVLVLADDIDKIECELLRRSARRVNERAATGGNEDGSRH